MSRRSSTPTFSFEFDEHGYPRARWSGPTDEAEPIPLLHFLESDLGFDTHYARQILDRGRETSSGASKPWRTTGNAFSLFVGPTESIITPLFGHPRIPIELPTADLLGLVDRWLRLVSPANENPDNHPSE